MQKFLQRILRNPIIRISDKYTSKPDKEIVHSSLSALHEKIFSNDSKRGLIIPFNINQQRFIVFSDHHKGAKNGADDFAFAEKNYLAALDYYYNEKFHLIALGDCEELWENSLKAVIKNNAASIEKEKKFVEQETFVKIFGNHDLEWDSNPFLSLELEKMYGEKIPIYEGLILQSAINNSPVEIYLTHGHQGDKISDGNWFSKFFVAKIWAPLQAYLQVNPNTPAYDHQLKTVHNRIMYEWISLQKNMLLITGHTHQPVFESLTHLEKLYRNLSKAQQDNDKETATLLEEEINKQRLKGKIIPDFTAYKRTYFNSGCCCFNDGDITGLEIVDGKIRLIKWEYNVNSIPERILLDETSLIDLFSAT